VIVDEVHERSVDSDFLLVILKQVVKVRPDFRLVLMSATIDSETFSSYFVNAPILNIPGFTHPVQDLFVYSLSLQKTFCVDFKVVVIWRTFLKLLVMRLSRDIVPNEQHEIPNPLGLRQVI
jgi:HrpA-like RNA helicase